MPIIALLLAFIGFFTYSFVFFSNSQRELEREIAALNRVNNLAMQISVLRQQSRNSVLSYRITRDLAHIQTINHINESIDLLLEEIHPLVIDDAGNILLSNFEKSREDLIDERKLFIAAIQNSNQPAMEKQFEIWQIKTENNHASLLDFISYNQKLGQTVSAVYDELINRIFYYALTFMLFMSVFIISLFLYLRKTITRPVKRLTLDAKNIAGGNFDLLPAKYSNDEIGMLHISLSQMAKKLHKQQQRLEAEYRKKELEVKRLREYEAQKDNFLSVASHELKSPVTSLKIYDRLLYKTIKKHGHKEYYAVYLDKIDKQIDKLTRLITSLLDVARLQTGKIPYHMAEFNLHELIDEAVYVAQAKTKKHQIKVAGKLDYSIYGDRDRIGQVLDNLLSNAIKYSPSGKSIQLKVDNNVDEATISVTDFGIGIDKEHHSEIFNRFYRVSGQDENTYPGFGVGLYISTEIVKQHGGRLWVESRKGKGSTFYFTLPRAK